MSRPLGIAFALGVGSVLVPGEPWSPQALPATVFSEILMQASELVHLAALIAAHGIMPVGARIDETAANLSRYWTASKCRQDRWQRRLRGGTGQTNDLLTGCDWRRLRPLIEEILLSEILTRVWTGFLVASDRSGATADAEPLARSVLGGQLEVRRRALSLLVHAGGVPVSDALAMNQLRRKAERWTDLLLGYLAPRLDLSDLAADPDRWRDFALDWRDAAEQAEAPRWQLLHASLQEAFPVPLEPRSPNADLNERIAASILACFPGEAFESTGLFHSLWMLRLRYATDALLDSLHCRV